MTVALSSFAGAAVPVGSLIPALAVSGGTPILQAPGTQEFLLAGAMVPYAAKYAGAVNVLPALGRKGRRQLTPFLRAAANSTLRVVHDGTNYQVFEFSAASSGRFQSTDLSGSSPNGIETADHDAAAAKLGSVGIGAGKWAMVAVQGSFMLVKTVGGSRVSTAADLGRVAFDGTRWVCLASDGNVYRVNATDPDQAWTGSAMTGSVPGYAAAIAGNGTTWVTFEFGQALRSSTDGVAYTTRTYPSAASGAYFKTPAWPSAVWTGTKFAIPVVQDITGAVRLITSTDGTTWTLDSADILGLVGAVPDATVSRSCIVSDGAGKVWLAVAPGAVDTYVIAYSADHGATWMQALLPGGLPFTGYRWDQMTIANGELFLNQRMTTERGWFIGATAAQIVDATPEFVGIPEPLAYSSTAPAAIRIK